MSELPERFFVAEIIRKHVFLQYRQEVPYGVTGGWALVLCGRAVDWVCNPFASVL